MTLTVGQALPATSVAASVSFTGQVATHPSQALVVSSLLLLDGSSNRDASGQPLALSWAILSAPSGSASTLTVTGTLASFSPDLPGQYKIRLRGANADGAYADSVYIYDAVALSANVAVSTSLNITTNSSTLNAALGSMVVLDSSNSSYGYASAISWTLTGKPLNSSTASLSTNSSWQTTFTPDVVGTYTVELLLTDVVTALTSKHTVTVNVVYGPEAVITGGSLPVASATGPAFLGSVGQTVKLHGSGSYDPSGAALTYQWVVSAAPYFSSATLSSTTSADVDFTPDLNGSYVFDLTVTSSSGYVSRKTVSLQVGALAPVAAVDHSQTMALAGSAISVSAAASSDPSGRALTFGWALDTKPTSSSATIATTNTSTLTFTPDVAGTYVASLTVSNGVVSTLATVTINAMEATSGTVPLTYRPLLMKYSKALDRAVIVTSNPNALHIVDVAGAVDQTVALPGAVKAMALSPNGQLAAVLYEGAASLIDLPTATLVQSSTTYGSQTEVMVDDNGLLYLPASGYGGYSSWLSVINGYTGAQVSPTGTYSYNYYGVSAGVLSNANGKIYAINSSYNYQVAGYAVNLSTGVVSSSSAISSTYSVSTYSSSLWLSGDQGLVFTNTGPYYRAADLVYMGTLGANTYVSVSHSSSAAEAVAMTKNSSSTYNFTTGTYDQLYQSTYKRYTGSLLFPANDVNLPLIGGAQSYGLAIFHRSDDTRAIVVQVGSNVVNGSGLQYFLIAR